VRGGGYSAAQRWTVTCTDGTTAFVKHASDGLTATWLRQEYRVYASLRAPFMPALLGWDDDGEMPVLVLEDLSGAEWRAAWTPARISRVLDTLHAIAATPPPAALPSLDTQRPLFTGWAHIAREPEAFLSLRLCTRAWLTQALSLLTRAEADARLAGDDLLHFDVRSDNLCFAADRVVLVDWNWACRGNRVVDVASWLPSLHAEGGPPPEAILPHEPGLAAAISGYFAARAGRHAESAQARAVRTLQLTQLRVALPWAVRALGLRGLDR
jgi:Ser/Thr protein kinase RdoA (MazF antagonist)